jgi:hypothetical protein
MMAEINIEWVKEQLTLNKTKKMTGDAVLDLLETWKSLKRPPKSDNSKEILDIFSKLALGYALVKENNTETWVQARAGAITVADVIRVKFDAFDEESGKHTLNGRKGKVVGVRYGDIILKSDDNKLPVLDGIHLRPENIEKRVS